MKFYIESIHRGRGNRLRGQEGQLGSQRESAQGGATSKRERKSPAIEALAGLNADNDRQKEEQKKKKEKKAQEARPLKARDAFGEAAKRNERSKALESLEALYRLLACMKRQALAQKEVESPPPQGAMPKEAENGATANGAPVLHEVAAVAPKAQEGHEAQPVPETPEAAWMPSES